VLLRALTGDLAGAAELSRQQAIQSGQQSLAVEDMLRRTAQILRPASPVSEEHATVEAGQAPQFQLAPPLPGAPADELPALLGAEEAAVALFQVGWAALTQGLVRDAEPCLLRAYELANETGQAATAVVAALQIAHLQALCGAPHETERWLTSSLAGAHQAPEAAWASIWPSIYQGFLWLLDDRLDEADARFTAMAEQLAGLHAFESHRAGVRVGQGLTTLERGHIERAEHLPEYARTAIELGRIERDFGIVTRALPPLEHAAGLAGEAGLVTLAAASTALHQRIAS
jgi:hypothetical protein